MNFDKEEIRIRLCDDQWPYEYTDHHRQIVRAVVSDGDGSFFFVRVSRDDDFGRADYIETAGGGVEEGETLRGAIVRELREELGAEVEILCGIGVVEDYYNLIHRHNINHYFLCKALSFGERKLTHDERECFHLSTVKLSYGEALREYEKAAETRLGRLVAQRELPILRRAGELLGADCTEN